MPLKFRHLRWRGRFTFSSFSSIFNLKTYWQAPIYTKGGFSNHSFCPYCLQKDLFSVWLISVWEMRDELHSAKIHSIFYWIYWIEWGFSSLDCKNQVFQSYRHLGENSLSMFLWTVLQLSVNYQYHRHNFVVKLHWSWKNTNKESLDCYSTSKSFDVQMQM